MSVSRAGSLTGCLGLRHHQKLLYPPSQAKGRGAWMVSGLFWVSISDASASCQAVQMQTEPRSPRSLGRWSCLQAGIGIPWRRWLSTPRRCSARKGLVKAVGSQCSDTGQQQVRVLVRAVRLQKVLSGCGIYFFSPPSTQGDAQRCLA